MIADFILRHAQPLPTCAGPAPRIGAETVAMFFALAGRPIFSGAGLDH